MRKLQVVDRIKVEENLFPEYRTFYHYFPFLMANELNIDLNIEDDEENIIIPFQKPKQPVLIAPYHADGRSILYDSDYIYKLEETVHIKNFRANIKKFDRDNKFELKKATESDAKEVIIDWYKKKKTEDFNYTLWFINNLKKFRDVHADIGYINDKPVAFSLWGELMDDTAVHIVSKDKGIPYLQDKMRMETYYDMLDRDFTHVNDGGDQGQHSLRMYKLKLRPVLINPIWSWRGVK